MHETGRGLSGRRGRELRLALVGLVFVAAVTSRVALAMNAAWRADGVGRAVALGAVEVLPLVNEAVLLPAGLVGTWLLLFGLDRSKRLQTPLAVLGAVAFVIVVVVRQEQWLDVVVLGRDWPALALGVVLGLVTGALPQVGDGRRSREFPTAARGLFAAVLLLGVVSLLDLYALGETVTVDGGVLPAPGTTPGTVVDLLAVGVFVAVVGWLVLYTDSREVAIVACDGTDAAAVLAALHDETDPAYDGTLTAGDGTAVLDAQGALRGGQQPDPIDGRVELSFLPPRRFSRWVTVGAEQHDPAEIDVERLGPAVDTPRPADLLGRLVPGRLRRRLQPNAVRAATKLRRADQVLFVVSADAFDVDESTDPGTFGPPDSLTACRELSGRFGRETERVAVLLGAERALRLYEADTGVAEGRLDDDAFRDWARNDLLELHGTTLVPLQNESEQTALLGNVAELRRRLER